MGRRVFQVLLTVLAVVASVLSSIVMFGSYGWVEAEQTFHPDAWSITSFFLGIVAAILLCWRHRWPEVITGIALLPPLVLVGDSMAALIALAALAARRRDHVLWIGAALVTAATARAVARDAYNPETTIAGLWISGTGSSWQVFGIAITTAVFVAVPLVVGIVSGIRNDLALREVHERELRAEMTRREERTRIAREMHDVLGHRLSLLSLQAGALEVSKDAQASSEAAKSVRTTARQSLDDLRQVIGVLRDGDAPVGEPAKPQPTLADIPELIANARTAGMVINVTILLNEAGTAPAQLGTATYRILQESLTNALRHAPGAPADLTVRGAPGAGLTIEVANPLPSVAHPSPGSGTGLTGVAERASLLGGSATAGPSGGMFALRAWLPWEAH
ncbi:sensor histidine kinase [Amycolatopsis sp. NPDC059657]|uniref:sensor histidine kinase n=1 Tax=Amycolatopsis sp. NPDC059657 TaxID=3346899 RepID=UPI00366A5F8A